MQSQATQMRLQLKALDERLRIFEAQKRKRVILLKRTLMVIGFTGTVSLIFFGRLALSDPGVKKGCLDTSRYFCFSSNTPATEEDNRIPEGWLLCDGSQVSRTYFADLFTAVGIAHGGGDGVETFHLPDYRGLFLRGVAHGAPNDPDSIHRQAPQPGANEGDGVGSIQMDATASPRTTAFEIIAAGEHVHEVYFNVGYDDNNHGGNNGRMAGADATVESPSSCDSSTAGNHTHAITGGDLETRPANTAVNWIIKY